MPAAPIRQPSRWAALDHRLAEPDQLGSDLGETGTDRGPDLDLREVKLVRDLVADRRPDATQDAAGPLAELARFGVDDLELFLDPDRELVDGLAHRELRGR